MRKITNIIKIAVLLCLIGFILHINSSAVFSVTTEKGEQTIEDGVYIIKSALNEKYVLDIYSSSKANDANLELWTNGETNNQKFTVKYLGDGYYSISPVHSGKYIDVANNSKTEGANVLQWEYHGGDNQKWIIKDAGNGYYNIISKSSGLYLDIPQSNSKDGANVQVWTKNGANNQKFKFEKQDETIKGTNTIQNETYQVKTASNIDNVMDVGQSSTKDGGNVGVWENSSTANQKFEILYDGEGYYTIKAIHSGKYLDVEGSSKKSGTNVDQWEYHGGNNQKWVIKEAGDGYYYVISKCNGLYLTVESSNLVTSTADFSNNQKFKFEIPTRL